MPTLELTTLQGPNTIAATAAIAELLSRRLAGVAELHLVAGDDHASRRARLLRGDLAIGWICAATFAGADSALELLAAPQWRAARYRSAPCYFADLIVLDDQRAGSFEELAGARWAYNEPRSLTGYIAVLAELARRGARRGFFSAALETGAHQASIDAVLHGRADVAAIDSTLLDEALSRRGELRERLRVVATLGPFSSPPWTVSRRVEPDLRDLLRRELLALCEHRDGRAALGRGELSRFVALDGDDYAAIAELTRQAEGVSPV